MNEAPMARPNQVRKSEIISALSLALDLTEGQPMGHCVNCCLLGMRVAQELRLSESDANDLYFATLLKDTGCSSNAARMYEIFGGDERKAKREVKTQDWTRITFEGLNYLLRNVRPGRPPHERMMAIAQVATANAVSVADAGVLDFAFRVFVDGFEHAVWAGVSAFFIGIAINYPRRRWQLILLGISMVAVLHGLNDWSVSAFNSYWPGILIQAVSLLLFIGYTMSASSIERQVRRTPLFRGDSIVMDVFSEPRDTGRS